MSIWTHIAGVVRLSDYNDDETSMFKIFKEGFDGNMPCGSEGSIQMFPIPKRLDYPTMRRQICFYGDLRDFGSNKVEVIRTWWSKIPEMLGNDRYVDQAIISIEPENGRRVILTEEDMQC